MWEYRGQMRPPFADVPGPGEESVWDYPRPPRIERAHRPVEVRIGGRVLVAAELTYRVLETASPPTFYMAADDVAVEFLLPCEGSSVCEWKGPAQYWALHSEGRSGRPIAWSFRNPTPEFAALAGHFSFFPGRVECYVAGERVQPQPGAFYGGWVTKEIVGPFKGEPGTDLW